MKRTLCLLLAVAVATVGLIVGTGKSSAAPQLPKFSLASDTFGTFGDHSFCRGAINVGLTAAPKKKGVVRVTLTSFGFTGDGSSWKRKPVCRLLVGTVTSSAVAFLRHDFFDAEFGPRRGQKVVKDIFTGSGLINFGVATYVRDAPVRVYQSAGTAHYVLVP